MPQRFLRPGIRTSEAWNKTSFIAQSLYIGILTLVDDFGRYDGRWRLLHSEIFGLRDDVKAQRTAAALEELCANGLIQHYLNDGKEYLQILRWSERARAETSRFPEPPQRSAADRSGAQEKDASLVPRSSPSPSPSPVHPRHPPRVGASKSRPTPLSIDELIAKYQKNPTYAQLNVRFVYGKMVAHCQLRGKQATERRLVDWLNREDKPLSPRSKVISNRFGPEETATQRDERERRAGLQQSDKETAERERINEIQRQKVRVLAQEVLEKFKHEKTL